MHAKSVAICLLLNACLVVFARAEPPRRLPPVDDVSASYVVADRSNAYLPSTHSNTYLPSANDFTTPADFRVACRDDSPACVPTKDIDDFEPWSTTEIQFQYGRLQAPSVVGGAKTDTVILTLQHASGWKFGDNFFFVDLLDDHWTDGFNDRDAYMEWYSHFSLGKIFGSKVGCGILTDVGIVGGVNYGADVNYLKWLPGMRLSWDLPGFAFFHSNFTALLDDNSGVATGGVPRETDSFMVDLTWDYPFSLGRHDFSVQGHVEFIGRRRNELGNRVSWWILAQPQFRYDLGKTLLGSPKKLYAGIEWQIFSNKLGDPETDENALQALFVWRL